MEACIEMELKTRTSYSNDSLYSIAAFLYEFFNEDVQYRVNTIRKLPEIALHLGEEETRDELLLFLLDLVHDVEEVQLALIEELRTFTPFIGGTRYVHCLLPILESFASLESNKVRKQAVVSLQSIVMVMDPAKIVQDFYPLVIRLGSADNWPSRWSSCGLVDKCYLGIPAPIREQFRNLFKKLCQDESPLVRRAAAIKFIDFIHVLEPRYIIPDFIPVWNTLIKDSQESVRFLAVEASISFSRLLSSGDNKAYLMPALINVAKTDFSPRVKIRAALIIRDFERMKKISRAAFTWTL